MNLLATLKLDTANFTANAASAKREVTALGTTAGAAAGPIAQTTQAMTDLNAAAKQTAPATSKAAGALGAVSAASGLASGTMTGAASGAMALKSALASMGVAAANPIVLVVALVAALVMLGKAIMDARTRAAHLKDSISLGNATSGIDSMRKGFERLVDTMDGAVGLMRELRALTREGADIDSDKRLAQIELDRKRELAAVAPGKDADKQAKAINARYDQQKTGAELDREQGGNTAAAAEARRQKQENDAAIAARREKIVELTDGAGAASRKALEFSGDSAGAGWFGKKRLDYGQDMTEKWQGVAKEKADEASRIAKEVEELERKNKVLAEQAALYEKRNEVVAIKRQANAVDGLDLGVRQEKTHKNNGMKVETDRLTRIGGVTNGGFGASSKSDAIADKQLSEQRLMRAALERIARKEAGAVLA